MIILKNKFNGYVLAITNQYILICDWENFFFLLLNRKCYSQQIDITLVWVFFLLQFFVLLISNYCCLYLSPFALIIYVERGKKLSVYEFERNKITFFSYSYNNFLKMIIIFPGKKMFQVPNITLDYVRGILVMKPIIWHMDENYWIAVDKDILNGATNLSMFCGA